MPDSQVAQSETLETIADQIVSSSWWGIPAEATRQKLKNDILSALRDEQEERGSGLTLTKREKQILIDHHNYEAEKAITRLGLQSDGTISPQPRKSYQGEGITGHDYTN